MRISPPSGGGAFMSMGEDLTMRSSPGMGYPTGNLAIMRVLFSAMIAM